MKAARFVMMATMAFALIGNLSGCGGNNASQTAAPPASETPAAAPAVAPAKMAPVGAAQKAGPFEVALSAALHVGVTKFEATITKNGKPVKNASVTMTTSMPSMGMPGPTADLKPAGAHYEGTAKTGMSGDWDATVSVKAAGASGHAAFRFKVKS
ncbi:MAG TPA: FixH family protein [Armatimonadota bacterium]|nr:FixH family protein [Armatimonadota bacterium]